MTKYSATFQKKRRESQLRSGLGQIAEEADDSDEAENKENQTSTTKAGNQTHIASQLQPNDAKSSTNPESSKPGWKTYLGVDVEEGEDEIDFETYKKQFEKEIAEKIKFERVTEHIVSQRLLDKAKGIK